MSVAGVVGLFRARPAGGMGEGGRMALVDHLRELRARILRTAVVLVAAIVVAFFFYDQLFNVIYQPYNDARQMLGHKVVTKPVINGVTDPFMIQLKICGVAALIGTCPYWLYQIWAFILPGLHPHERRWTRVFAAVAGPLFVLGVCIGYYVLPKGLQVLIGFTPAQLTNLVPFTGYFSFFTRMLLVFGIAFEIPLFVVLLNLAGVLPGRVLKTYRPWIIVGVFVFAAVATPSTDPFSMTMLAVPMTVLFLLSEAVARTVDRRRASGAAYSGPADDVASEPHRPAGLDEEDD